MTDTNPLRLRGYPAQWTRPAPPYDSCDVTVIGYAGRARITGARLVTVQRPQAVGGLIFTTDEAALICLHDGEADTSDCLLEAIRRKGPTDD